MWEDEDSQAWIRFELASSIFRTHLLEEVRSWPLAAGPGPVSSPKPVSAEFLESLLSKSFLASTFMSGLIETDSRNVFWNLVLSHGTAGSLCARCVLSICLCMSFQFRPTRAELSQL